MATWLPSDVSATTRGETFSSTAMASSIDGGHSSACNACPPENTRTAERSVAPMTLRCCERPLAFIGVIPNGCSHGGCVRRGVMGEVPQYRYWGRKTHSIPGSPYIPYAYGSEVGACG